MKRLIFFISCLFLLSSAQALDLKPWKGGPTPPLALNDLNGKPHKLEDYRGKVVMVQFWATYCPPCIKEMPSMVRLESRLAGKPFVILAVNMGETKNEILDFRKKSEHGFHRPHGQRRRGAGRMESLCRALILPAGYPRQYPLHHAGRG